MKTDMNDNTQQLENRIIALEQKLLDFSIRFNPLGNSALSSQVFIGDVFPASVPNSYGGASTNFMMWGTFTVANGGPTTVVTDSRILSTSRCFAQYDGTLAAAVGSFGCTNGSASINITGQTGTQPWNFLIIF